MIIPHQQNIKVHFAAGEHIIHFYCCQAVGVKYSLYTAFPYCETKVFGKTSHPAILADMTFEEIPRRVDSLTRYSIQDSGLFSLMFGKKGLKLTPSIIEKWYHALVEHTIESGFSKAVVEVDCQKLFGPELAWKFRRQMKKDLPNRQINVFHKEDGQKGLDEMIEFSDYIAISVPELRNLGQKGYTVRLANYIKNKKPNIDIHLLGCTELKLLEELRFCTSADSTSYLSANIYGFVKGRHVSRIDIEKVRELITPEEFNRITQFCKPKYASALVLNTHQIFQSYVKAAGNQD